MTAMQQTDREDGVAARVHEAGRGAGAGAASGERSLPVTLPREVRMRAVVGAIARHAAEHGYAPSVQELMDETGFSSLSVVHYSLDWCEEAGLIVRARGIARGITLTEAGRAFAEASAESGEPPGPESVS